MKRIKRTEKEWLNIQEAWIKSGKSRQEFCKENRIPLSSFCRWRTKLNGCDVKETDLVKVRKDRGFSNDNILIQTNYCKVFITGSENENVLCNIFKVIRDIEYADRF